MRGVRVVTDVEAGCDGRGRYRTTSDADADGEDAWSWHPLAGAKLAGGDLPATVTKRSWTPGRARRTPLTPLRREGRVAPVEPVVDLLVCFFPLHARPRVRPASGFPCALCFRGIMCGQNPGERRRGNGESCLLSVIASQWVRAKRGPTPSAALPGRCCRRRQCRRARSPRHRCRIRYDRSGASASPGSRDRAQRCRDRR